MKIDASSDFSSHAEKMDRLINSTGVIKNGTSGMEMKIGLASDGNYGISGNVASPTYVGDGWAGDSLGVEDAAIEAAADKDSVGFSWKWNSSTKKFDRQYSMVTDAAPDFISAQLLTPSSANWINKAFKPVMSYSNFDKLVTVEQGDNPWATVQNKPLLSYGGAWPTVNMAGTVNNVDTFHTWARADAMVNQVVNMEIGYQIGIDELVRQQGGTYPLSGQAIMAKQQYSQWALDTFEAVVGYYGNTATDTKGLLNVTTAVSWGGTSLTDIKNGVSTTKGSLAYQAVANAIADFLSTNLNKPNLLRIAVSPLAYNILGSLPYSDAYSSVSALQALITNFDAGLGPKNTTPAIQIYADPLLGGSASGNLWNSNVYDYMVITAPKIVGGLDEEDQDLLVWGKPLDRFIFPAVPGPYCTQYKTLKRISGMFAPYTAAVKVYYGFGID